MNFATKQDFNELQRQLKANTELVETIKSEVGQRDWAKREWTNLRRTKLEALLTALHDCDAYLDRHRHNAAEGKVIPERDPQTEIDTISVLYFPELRKEALEFSHAYRMEIILGNVLVQELLNAGQDHNARQNAYDKFSAQFDPTEALERAAMLRNAARKVIVDIMGVEEGSRDNRSDAPTETH
ncbi:MAG TPA: hypothetical protein VE222_07140 [Nitrospiraceae bacterium]|nr:hypothetical protein [Nitrospiraceae bacterium]